MFRPTILIDSFTAAFTDQRWSFLLHGLALGILAVGILLAPNLLVVLVSSSVLFLDLVFVMIAFRTQMLGEKYRVMRDSYFDVV